MSSTIQRALAATRAGVSLPVASKTAPSKKGRHRTATPARSPTRPTCFAAK
jgi:hypothetical protein